MEARELLSRVEADLGQRDLEMKSLVIRLQELESEVRDLTADRRALRGLIAKYGDVETRAEAAEAEDTDAQEWRCLSKGDAVERALREGGEMSPREIVDYLVAKGRPRDSTANISAAISHVRGTRDTVERVGPGRWRYKGRTFITSAISGLTEEETTFLQNNADRIVNSERAAIGTDHKPCGPLVWQGGTRQ